MTQERATPNGDGKSPYQKVLAGSHYALLGLHPAASVREIRQAYRDLSKQYHPDTTLLPASIATTKFQQLNEAYATLSSPEQRQAYDRKIGYSSVSVMQPLPSLKQTSANPQYSSSAYLDPTDRPLSPGEIFALFILGITFLACLFLAITIGLTRGETVLQPPTPLNSVEPLRQAVVTQSTPLEPAISPNSIAPPDAVPPSATASDTASSSNPPLIPSSTPRS